MRNRNRNMSNRSRGTRKISSSKVSCNNLKRNICITMRRRRRMRRMRRRAHNDEEEEEEGS